MSEPADCTVLIAAADQIAMLTAQLAKGGTEVLAFADDDALRALDAISRRHPHMVVLERPFAVTPRGVALINRLNADPGLTQSEIRVVSRPKVGAAERPIVTETPDAPARAAVSAPPTPAAALDQRGTRRATRFPVPPGIEVDLGGNKAAVIDLSALGAQVISAVILRPNQKVRVILLDEQTPMRCNGVVAWANYEMPPKTAPRYRAGIEFLDAPPGAVDAFRLRRS